MLKSHWRICSVPSPAFANAFRHVLLALCIATLAVEVAHPQSRDIQRLSQHSSPSGDSIYFDAGATAIDLESARLVERHATRLRAQPGLHLTIIAHTDELGSSSLELARGQQRLDAVRRILEEAKIHPSRIRTLNHGSEEVADGPCDNEGCRRQRRRIDFLFHE